MFRRMEKCFCNKSSLRTGSLAILWFELIIRYIQGLIGGIGPDRYYYSGASHSDIAYVIINLFVLFLAIHGITKKEPSHMFPYMVISAVRMILLMLFVIFLFGTLFIDEGLYTEWVLKYVPGTRSNVRDLTMVGNIVVLLVAAVIIFSYTYYTLSIIISHYKDLKEKLATGGATNISKSNLLNCESDTLPSPI